MTDDRPWQSAARKARKQQEVALHCKANRVSEGLTNVPRRKYPPRGRDALVREAFIRWRVCILSPGKGSPDDGPDAADGAGAEAPHRVG